MATSLQGLWGVQKFLPYIVCKLRNTKKVSHFKAETHIDCNL